MPEFLFNQKEANEIIHELGYCISNSEEYEDFDWINISVVIELSERERQYGFVYTADGDWEAETPDFECLDIAKRLKDVTTVKGESPWKKCLIQIERESGGIEIAFDYEGDNWPVNPSNPEELAFSLNPKRRD